MAFELILAFAKNLREVFIFLAIILGLASVGGCLLFAAIVSDGEVDTDGGKLIRKILKWLIPVAAVADGDGDGDVAKYLRKNLKWLIPTAIGVGLLACLPTVDDLWRVRVGLIKYSLASPENLREGKDAIERVAKKLECKYLGGADCEDPKKESK